MPKDRGEKTVWLYPKQLEMLAQMPDINFSKLVRDAIEEHFEARNDRECTRMDIESDLEELLAKWRVVLGVTAEFTVTSTEDGFRAVVAVFKKFNA